MKYCKLLLITLILFLISTMGCSNTASLTDDVTFQEALDALPQEGGTISVRPSHYIFTKTATRKMDNVTIIGQTEPRQVYFSNNNKTPIFTVGGNGWTFIDLNLDLGSINYNGYQDVILIRVNILNNSSFPKPPKRRAVIK